MLTTHGEIDEKDLVKTVGVEDRPDLIALWIEWRHNGELVRRDAFPLYRNCEDPVYTAKGMVPREQLQRYIRFADLPLNYVVTVEWYLDSELVRTDPNVIIKNPGVVAVGVAGSFGG